jgi:rhodanese-related sulfurtransferase
MNTSRLAPLAFVLLPLVGCAAPSAPQPAATAEAAEPFGRLSIDDTLAKIDEAKSGKLALLVVDVNGKERYAAGHVPGAKSAPADVTAADLPADKATMLVFYCGSEHCMACHQAAKNAVALGYSRVFIMPDGIKGWEQANKPVEKS